MIEGRPSFALRLDLVLTIIGAVSIWVLGRLGFDIPEIPLILFLVIFLTIVHIVIYFKIMLPLKRFAEIADNIADGELETNIDQVRSSELGDLHHSFSKITANLVEYRAEIESYMKEISEKNKQPVASSQGKTKRGQ